MSVLLPLMGIAAALALGFGARGQDVARAQGSASVSIVDFAFNPERISVPAGTTVTWTNTGDRPHTATSGTPGASNAGSVFKSERLAKGEAFSFNFSEAGTFVYFCEVHNNMRATVEVTEAGAAPPAVGDAASAVKVVGQDYSFTAPDSLPAGIVTLSFSNEGAEPHHAQIARLNDGVTMQQLGAAFASGPESALALLGFYGGAGTIDPGGSQEVAVSLIPGNYLFLCFVSGPDDVPHLAKGMIKPFQVAAGGSTAAAPKEDGVVGMKDFSFAIPNIKAGPTTLQFANAGEQTHEFNLLKLNPGATPDDVFAFFSGAAMGPPPFASAGGFQGIDKGGTGWAKLNLTSGTYLALCNIPDPATGKSHAELGMIAVIPIP